MPGCSDKKKSKDGYGDDEEPKVAVSFEAVLFQLAALGGAKSAAPSRKRSRSQSHDFGLRD